jgi:hypothetical protein
MIHHPMLSETAALMDRLRHYRDGSDHRAAATLVHEPRITPDSRATQQLRGAH